jgi:uncharacterized protein (TIGR02118 family)
MVTVIAMMKRRNGMSPDDFARYWLEKHAPLGFEVLPEDIRIRGYVQNYTVRTPGDAEPEFDGVVEFYLDDQQALQRWLQFYLGEEGRRMREDEANFMDSASVKVLVVDEQVVVAPEWPD